ncbi:hypothetical protein Y032_0142g2336 [Ancylostoma ceylanicum]|uniref:Uncharacterized protein n=1 Tax=Ancylostoma ceylanicum TaxID=53326 RepID=A0A016T2R1_9BILA|nr:hypothetical protein Y032_0142g2336 [Ancylostoma ceylanicum]
MAYERAPGTWVVHRQLVLKGCVTPVVVVRAVLSRGSYENEGRQVIIDMRDTITMLSELIGFTLQHSRQGFGEFLGDPMFLFF